MLTEDQAFPLNAVLCLDGSEPMTATSDPLEYWKEIAHEGEFVKDTGNSRMNFRITRTLMDHWHQTFGEMSHDGVSVPVPIEHTRDPEKRRATVVEMARRPNKKGISALYAKIRFRDQDAAKLAKTANVSIFVPKKATNGHGKEYVMPVEHVAITDYPVLHDLEPFQAIALSLASDGDPEVTLRELATQAGIDPSITDEQQLLLALSQKLQALKPPAPPPGAPPAGPPRPPMRPGFGASKGGDIQPLSGTLLSTIKNARRVQLDALATGPEARITPATRDKLAERFLSDEVLAFSHADGFDDGFDSTLEALAQNPPIRQVSRTGPQGGVALSRGAGEAVTEKQGADSPLVKGMEALSLSNGKVRSPSYM